MSGGNPGTLKTVIGRLELERDDSSTAIGILSYLHGAPRAAELALRGIDPMQEPPELGAFLALVKGSVMSVEDPRGARRLLDQARLLSPGTLVEEAALRRSMALDATLGNAEGFALASDQYVRGYLRSPYASQFADAFVAGVVTLHETIDLAKVVSITALMTREQREVIYLRIARRAAIEGLNELSNFASARANDEEPLSEEKSDPRALLYASLAGITTEPIDDVKARLAGIDRSMLSPGDRKLYDAVTAVAREVTRAPVGTDTVAQPGPTSEPGVVDAPSPPQSKEADAEVPEAPKAQVDPAEAPVPAVPPSAPAEATAPAGPEPQNSGETAAKPAEAKPEMDATETMLTEGRKRLADIDKLLAETGR